MFNKINKTTKVGKQFRISLIFKNKHRKETMKKRPKALKIHLMAHFSTWEQHKQSPEVVLSSHSASITNDPETSQLMANCDTMTSNSGAVSTCITLWLEMLPMHQGDPHPRVSIYLWNLVQLCLHQVFYSRSTDPIIWGKALPTAGIS